MISRNALVGIIVLMAGLSAGYFVSLAMNSFHDRVQSDLPYGSAELAIPDPSLVMLSSMYEQSRNHFNEALNQGADVYIMAPEGSLLPGGRELDLLRLVDYYRQFFLHYYRWVDTGNMQSAVRYKLALGQFRASLDYLEEKYADDPFFTSVQQAEFRQLMQIAEQCSRSIRWAKFVTVILFFLLVMGIPGMIRASGYKKFAASLYYDSVFRPHYISDLNAWYSKNFLAFVLVFSYLIVMLILSSFSSWKFPLIFVALGLLPTLIITALLGSHRRLPEKLVSLLTPQIIPLLLVLTVIALRGPLFFGFRFWTSEIFRSIFLALIFMLLFRKFHVTVILSRQWSHRNRRASAALVSMAYGIQFLSAGVLLYIFGPEESLAALNREVLLLPGGFFEAMTLPLFWPMMLTGIVTACSFILLILNRKPTSEYSG